MKLGKYAVLASLLLAATGSQAGIVAGQWLQVNFTDGWNPAARNWNYYLTANSPTNATTGNTTDMIDSEGNTVDGVSLTASGWAFGGWPGPGHDWIGNGVETAGSDGLGGNHLIQSDESNNFWWGLNSTETVAIHGLDTGLSYNVKLYSLNNGTGNDGETTTVDLNGSTTASFPEVERWNSTTTPYVWNSISATGAGELVFSIDSTINDNPVINAIVIEAVTNSPASMVAGQWLQINFTDGFYADAAGTHGATPGGGGLRNWNYYLTANSPTNASTGNTTDMIDSEGNVMTGISLSASGWAFGGWSGGIEWGGNGLETAGPDGLGGNHLMEQEETINFWWGLNSMETVTIHGVDANLIYNVKVYMINTDVDNGEWTSVDLNGNASSLYTDQDRWNSTTTPYAWNNVFATGAGDLVFHFVNGAWSHDNPVLNAIVIEAAENLPPPEFGDIAVGQLPGSNGLVLTWATTNGFNYTLQSKHDLQYANWTNDVTEAGTGGDVSATIAADQTQSFLRVVAQRPQGGDLIESQEFVKIFDQSVGESQPWYINDHCFIQAAGGTWHLFGITHEEPANPIDEDNFAHATADSLLQQPWDKQPFALTVAPGAPWNEEHLWAPHIISHEGTYYMYYCAGAVSHTEYKIHLATSPDLENWVRHPANPMVVDGFDGRDPCIFRYNDQWIMYYTANRPADVGNHVVVAVTSDDLIHWGDKRVVFTHPAVGTFGGPTESPFVVERKGKFYLFVCTNNPYDNTAVYESDSPFEWDIRNQVGDFPAHCAEVISLPNGEWYISRAGWGRGGVYLAKLIWND